MDGPDEKKCTNFRPKGGLNIVLDIFGSIRVRMIFSRQGFAMKSGKEKNYIYFFFYTLILNNFINIIYGCFKIEGSHATSIVIVSIIRVKE